MEGKEYMELAMRTAPEMDAASKLSHGILGINSEAGELAGIVQKVYQGHLPDREHMLKEVGDCYWFLAEICYALGTTPDEVMEMNIEKLKARYPEGFDPEKSLHRAEGDI